MTVGDEYRQLDVAMRLTLEVWHPDSWMLKTSRLTDVGLLNYSYHSGEVGTVTSLFTLYADSGETIDTAIYVIRNVQAVDDVRKTIDNHCGHIPKPGNVTRELVIEHDGTTQIYDEFTKHGFIPGPAVDIRADTEYWTVFTYKSRDRIHTLLDKVESENDASVTVTSVTQTPKVGRETPLPRTSLSSRQREIFRLARKRGYYDHPRQMSADELADELEITTSTLHEHLRKAEAKLLGEHQ